MEFSYNAIRAYTRTIDIANPGNTNLEATTDSGTKYYLMLKSYLGIMVALEYGPLYPLEEEGDIALGAGINKTECILTKQEFNQRKLHQIIETFIAPKERGKVQIIDVKEITEEEALNKGVNLFDYIKNFNKE